MNIKIINTPYSDYGEILRDLDEKLSGVEFEPKVLLVFLTSSVYDIYDKILDYLKVKFPGAKMAGCFVEGYATSYEVWMRGLAILMIDSDRVDVFWARGRNTTETFTKLRSKIGVGWNIGVLIYPLIYFPSSRFNLLKAYFNNIITYNLKYKRARTLDEKLKILKEYSNMLESKYIYPVNKVLRLMPEDFSVVGMNLIPLEAKLDTPKIFVNYGEIGRGAVSICFKGKIRAIFHDVFPERGASFEETVEILKDYFPNVEIVNTIKKGITIGEINGIKPVDFLSIKVKAYKQSMNKDTALNRLEKGRYQMVTPYGLAFISKETYGSSTLGLYPHPVNLYPSLFELDKFYDTALFCGEIFRGGVTSFSEPFELKRYDDSFDLIIVDHNTIPMFGRSIHRIVEFARESSTEFLCLFSLAPSMKDYKARKMFLSEVENGIMFNASGTLALIEIYL